jgi:VTC domain
MLSPVATSDVAVRSAPSRGERELKFTLPEGRVDLARRWLDRVCRRDAEFPEATVWTIYYDTPGLISLSEKINSDYLKRKIRVRWYSDLSGTPSGPVFVEAKLRVGNRRTKVRARLPYEATEVARWDLQDPRLRAAPLALRDSGILECDSWQPMMLLRYRRDRYIEPLSDSRISLDSDIAATAVRAFASIIDDTSIGVAVLEVKGGSDELPHAMRPLLRLGLRKRSFSKFLVVYAHMTRQVL